MNETCGCCEGVHKLTPQDTANRPGLDALFYRVGTHASFLETMIARLSNLSLDVPLNVFDVNGLQEVETVYSLQQLTTRASSDPALAFLDAWATVADVLTFYQERIANEGYLRTATERRSILELARLVGYVLCPGVSASVFLAYTLEKDHNVIILPNNRAQSVPGPGEKAQTFETAEKLEARVAWNTLKPRLTLPQLITTGALAGHNPLLPMSMIMNPVIYLQGVATNVKAGDPLLFLFPVTDRQGNTTIEGKVSIVIAADKQPIAKRTKVTLDLPDMSMLRSSASTTRLPNMAAMALQGSARLQAGGDTPSFPGIGGIVHQLALPPSLQPPNKQRLALDINQTYSPLSDIHPQLLINAVPQLQNTIYSAVANTPIAPTTNATGVQVFRVTAAPFGHNAPPPVNEDGRLITSPPDWPLVGSRIIGVRLFQTGQLQIAAVTAPPPPFDGKFPFNYEVTIKVAKDTEFAGTPVTKEVGGDEEETITVDGHNVKVTITNEQALLKEAIFDFQDIGQKMQITKDGSNWNVQVGGASFTHVTSLKQVVDAGEVEIRLADDLLVGLSMASNNTVLALDAQYDKIAQASWVVIERPDTKIVAQIQNVQTVFLDEYGIKAKVTQLVLDRPWLTGAERLLSDIRGIVIYAQSEPRDLAEAPIEEDIAATKLLAAGPQLVKANTLAFVQSSSPAVTTTTSGTDTIELDQLYDGLKAGQRMIVFGERTDVLDSGGNPIRGIMDGELVMLKAVKQDVFRLPGGTPLPNDKKHTFLIFANALQFTYRRETVVIYGNVVRATHGETRNEVLGSGDGSKELQEFTLRQFPLTYVSASTPSGVQSTLQVRINDILWHEAGSLPELHATDRGFITETDDASKTTVIFGNGVFGARLPTGIENVKATYRTGIGKPGNVRAGQITLLSTKPLGVKGVVNPLAASGGADPENRDQARRNVPLAALALDRLVAVEDYEHFARTFGGVGKASAVPLSDGRRQLVHLTIVGADNIPILPTSDLYRNLVSALGQFGDPNEPFIVAVAEVRFLVLSARVHLLPDFQFESVEPIIRTTLLDAFSFDRRQLGQPIFQSEVISAMQSVVGVDYVDLEVMGAVDQATIVSTLTTAQIQDMPGQPDPSEQGKSEQDETGEEGESPEVENAEEFIELLGLADHTDVNVQLARFDKNNLLATNGIAPAQLAFLTPDVPDTLILSELP